MAECYKTFLPVNDALYQTEFIGAPMHVTTRSLFQFVVLSGPPTLEVEPTVLHSGVVLASDQNQAVARAILQTKDTHPQADLSGVSVHIRTF